MRLWGANAIVGDIVILNKNETFFFARNTFIEKNLSQSKVKRL